MSLETRRVVIERVGSSSREEKTDTLSVEEPLEIQVGFFQNGGRVFESLSVTMRTPGQDRELAAGFLFTEGLIEKAEDIDSIEFVKPPNAETGQRNTLRVELAPGVSCDLSSLRRRFLTSSSCGVCGKASLEALKGNCAPLPLGSFTLQAAGVAGLPQTLRASQPGFEKTGGLHACGLFDRVGTLLSLKEDVGRHNALDKLIGAEFLERRLPLSDRVLLLSGRVSFELVQKAARAGVPLLAAVGAPSSLAVETAERFGLTLIGFVREDRFNLYTHGERISG